jgi:hypothetical protein
MATQENTSVSAGQQFFTALLENLLEVPIIGFQQGFGIRPDMILFSGPFGATCAIPRNTIYEPREQAREVVRVKIEASKRAFNDALDSEDIDAVNRFWATNTERAVRETNIGQELLKRSSSRAA